ncbi:MAG TPA: 3-dehydroquinate synthase [Pyrinomonadaceae bacterium]|jgi:3-dehydroquinate synthase
MTDQKESKCVRVRLKKPCAQYDIIIGSGSLDCIGNKTRTVLGDAARRIVVISNRKVLGLYGSRVTSSLRKSGFKVENFSIGDGERHKSFRTLQRVLFFLANLRLERSDAIVALGGGVVGDVAGLAAALYMRGIAFIQVPTTLLAQIDASVGGKTAVNLSQGKNLVGAFHQPRAVIIDIDVLATLPKRELTSGWCEAIKQGAVGSRSLFDRTRRVLADGSYRAKSEEQLVFLIAAQCRFKAKIVAGDEGENLQRTDRTSRRVLNFGHTVGHALELVTGYRRFRHGEAVGVGMLVAGEISLRSGLLKESEFQALDDTIRLAGQLPRTSDLDYSTILNAAAGDKKSVKGSIQWVLLERIGRACIVDAPDIPQRVLNDSVRSVRQRAR